MSLPASPGPDNDDPVMTRAEVARRTKEILVDGLRLEITPEEIIDADPIFGEVLGLDSIDILEFVQLVEQEFGVSISDEEVVRQALASIDTLADFILAQTEEKASL
jgi:acyl carrier protein